MLGVFSELRRRFGRWSACRSAATRPQLERLARDQPEPRANLLRSFECRIDTRDGMYSGDGVHYFWVGLSALDAIEEALRHFERPEPRAILDLPSGYGRVLRALRARYPASAITACELDRDAVDFCARVFGAERAYSTPDFDQVALGKSFDLIWCGSLATHLDERGTLALLRLFFRHLAPGGVAVFSMHGRHVIDEVAAKFSTYGLDRARAERLQADVSERAYAFTNYGHEAQPGYGLSLTMPRWVTEHLAETGRWAGVRHKERGWAGHHDTFAVLKAS